MANFNARDFFGAIGTYVSAANESLPRDLTIDAEIVSIMNIGVGEYKVDYQGNIMSAYDENGELPYKVGERVYVLVPQGDMSKKKIIQGRASYRDASSSKISDELKNFYVDRGPNLVSLYLTNDELQKTLGICSCPAERDEPLKPPAKYRDDLSFPEGKMTMADSQVAAWSATNEYIKIQADFQTIFNKIHSQGKYFLRVQLLQVNPQPKDEQDRYKMIDCDLDFKSFNGVSSYSIAVPSTQKGYFQVAKGSIVGIASIALMQDGNMEYDVKVTYNDETGLPEYDKNNKIDNVNNILANNIEVTFAEKINLTGTMYYAYIETPMGAGLFEAPEQGSGIGQVKLVPHFLYGDSDIINQGECRVHWFKQDPSVTESSAADQTQDEYGKTYFDYGGAGWAPIDELYPKEGNTLLVNIDSVPWKWKYKVVITYAVKEIDKNDGREYVKEVTQTSAIQEVIRLDSIYDLALQEADGNTPGAYEIIDRANAYTSPWGGDWYSDGFNGGYNHISNGIEYGAFNVVKSAISSWSTVYANCYLPSTAGQTAPSPIGVLELQLAPEGTEVPFVVDWKGRDYFNYDAQGTWKGETESLVYVLTPIIKFTNGPRDYGLEVLAPNGDKLLMKNAYPSAGSEAQSYWNDSKNGYLVKNVYIDADYSIHFSISEKYSLEKAYNNIFTLRIFTDDGKTYEFKKQLTFIKDGDLGTNGTEWNVKLRPCRWDTAEQEGLFSAPYPDDTPCPIIIQVDGSGYQQHKDSRLFLRPYVTRRGTLLENLDKEQAYFYRCHWDVRMPGSEARDVTVTTGTDIETVNTQGASHLRLYLPQVQGGIVGEKSEIFDVTGAKSTGDQGLQVGDKFEDIRVNKKYDDSLSQGLFGYTSYPKEPDYGRIGVPQTEEKQQQDACYGAVEVRYVDDGIFKFEQLDYRAIVKCTVDIMQSSTYNDSSKTRGGIQSSAYARNVTSLVCYYPVDIFYDNNYLQDNLDSEKRKEFFDSLTIDLPTTIKYDSIGYTPELLEKPLNFKVEGASVALENLTPRIFSMEQRDDGYHFTPSNHLSKQEGFHGVIRTAPGVWPKASGSEKGNGSWYLRNVIMYYNRFGNVDINGWDGQGLDTNEEDGTIFGATFGAGWKGALSNAFTGVIMGVDKSVKREDYNDYIGELSYPTEASQSHPYLTGLFGYQEGIQSFGLLENGTAFFGRADRGGRIIIDGSNAIIYGGAHGMVTAPSIKDDMSNTMRINLVDLQHTKEGAIWSDDVTESQAVSGYSIKNGDNGATKINLLGDYFGFNEADKDLSARIPEFYKEMWNKAYIQKDGVLPYWLKDANQSYSKLPSWEGQQDSVNTNWKISYADDCWVDINTDEINAKYSSEADFPSLKSEEGKELKYDDTGHPSFLLFPSSDENIKVPSIYDEDGEINKEHPALYERLQWLKQHGANVAYSTFGASRMSTTPAIEIGQHIPGLKPGLLDWSEDIFMNLEIPGYRNFMVTYDGTMWAMNGVFMGSVIGSNIIGGRIQAAQIGVGPAPTDTVAEGDNIATMFGEGSKYNCDWEQLSPPKDGATLPTDYPAFNTGYAMTLTKDGIVTIGGEFVGGSIDIGHFHIIGKKTIDRIKAKAKEGDPPVDEQEELGHLIQTGLSDFIGLTHFYGNVGIAPSATDTSLYKNSGSLIQTSGFTALGVVLPKPKSSSDETYLTAHKQVLNYSTGRGTKFAAGDQGPYNIGKGSSVEENSVFALDSRGSNNIYTDLTNGVNGHFWPLHFHSKTNGKRVESYVTVMDQFAAPASTIEGDKTFAGSNYFRVSPWGIEGQELFIRGRFQPEKDNTQPQPDDFKSSPYLGYIGAVSRAGYGGKTEIDAGIVGLGITAWNNYGVFFHSDDNFAARTRRSSYLYSNFQSSLDKDKTFTEKEGDNDRLANTAIQMAQLKGQTAGLGFIDIKTAVSPIGIGVFGTDPQGGTIPYRLGDAAFSKVAARGNTNQEGRTCGAVISLNPYAERVRNTIGSGHDKVPTLAIGLNSHEDSGGIHLYCGGKELDDSDASADCRVKKWSETFLTNTEIRSWAENKVGLYSKTCLALGIEDNGVHGVIQGTGPLAHGIRLVVTKGENGEGKNEIYFDNYDAESQHGIYARFA